MSKVETARMGLCQMIATGELKPGELLPSENELCERFGVSRGSLREAQKMLKVAGALKYRPGSGMRVSEMNSQDIMSGLEMVIPLLPLSRFLELFAIREVLEGFVTAQAAARMDSSTVRKLRELGEKLSSTPPSDEAQYLDAKFHSLIIRSAQDPMVESLLETIRRRGRDYRIFENQEHSSLKDISDESHLAIVDAIESRDPEAARFLAMEHVRATRKWLEGIAPGPVIFEQSPSPRS